MGGYGSGRWGWHDKATTVEECRTLDVARWVHEGIIAPDTHRWGGWTCTNSYTGEQVASIGYEVNTTGAPPRVRLFYRVTPREGEPEHYDYKILLTTTRPYFGGRRWWFICPLVKHGRACTRRAGKLYLPPGGRYFGCRACYELSYTSSQESDKRISRLANDPMALDAALSQAIGLTGDDTLAGSGDLLLALKAAHLRNSRRH